MRTTWGSFYPLLIPKFRSSNYEIKNPAKAKELLEEKLGFKKLKIFERIQNAPGQVFMEPVPFKFMMDSNQIEGSVQYLIGRNQPHLQLLFSNGGHLDLFLKGRQQVYSIQTNVSDIPNGYALIVLYKLGFELSNLQFDKDKLTAALESFAKPCLQAS